jgi:hypothetical protein
MPVDSKKSAIPGYCMVQWQCDGGSRSILGLSFFGFDKIIWRWSIFKFFPQNLFVNYKFDMHTEPVPVLLPNFFFSRYHESVTYCLSLATCDQYESLRRWKSVFATFEIAWIREKKSIDPVVLSVWCWYRSGLSLDSVEIVRHHL